MTLKTKLILLSLLTLLLPWSAWKLLQELESYLRLSQEQALLATARITADSIPLGYQTQLAFLPDTLLRVDSLPIQPVLDGYAEGWSDPSAGRYYASDDGQLKTWVRAGRHRGRLYLLFSVEDATSDHEWPGPADSIELLIRNPRGLFRFDIRPGAPGPLQLRSEGGDTGQVEGFWQDTETGYQVELSFPGVSSHSSISFLVRDAGNLGGAIAERFLGTLQGSDEVEWITLQDEWTEMSDRLRRVVSEGQRIWLLGRDGWVLADTGLPGEDEVPRNHTTWAQRALYRLVTGSPPEFEDEWREDPLRIEHPLVDQALAGEEGMLWTQAQDTAVVRNTIAVPVRVEGEVLGAVVVQSVTDGLLLVTNAALGRLLFTTLGLALGLALGMWWFATRLSRRVRRLSGAVSHAMDDGSKPVKLPLQSDRDELGELARNNGRLLQAVADYSQYLQTLAGKLSHELKTPLAITRSSLENLDSLPSDADSRRYLERAREGVDRQDAIVRAMSEASRLEASMNSADWETVDLVALIERCVEGYRTVHPDRRIELKLMKGPLPVECAPDLLAQALDKLVDNALSLTGAEDVVSLHLRKDGDVCHLAVCNTGTALPAEFQDRLFDSLVSLREKRGGGPHLGLGLYIVRLVVTAHAGQVAARNLPDGRGVEIEMILPLQKPGR